MTGVTLPSAPQDGRPAGLAEHLAAGGTVDAYITAHRDVRPDVVIESAASWARDESFREGLVAQLAELNRRSQVYSTQSWQLPVAYVTGSAVLSSQLVNAKTSTAAAGFALAAVVGLLLVIHLIGVWNGGYRAVVNINVIEAALGLPRTAIHRERLVVGPMVLILLIVTLALAGQALITLAAAPLP